MTRPEIHTVGQLERSGAIIAIQDGNHGAAHPKAADYVEDGIPFIMSRNLRDGRVLLDGCEHLRREQADLLRVGFARPGDVLLSHKGTLGEVAVLPPLEAYAMLTPQVTYYRVNEDLLRARYLACAFRSPAFKAEMFAIGNQSTRPFVSISAQRQLHVPVPPAMVQDQIVYLISSYDELIGSNLRRIQVLEEMARSIYREWFVSFRHSGSSNSELVDSELGPIPADWAVVPLSEILELAYGKALKADDRRAGPVAVYGSSGIVGWHDRSLVRGPGIVVGRKGNVGAVHWSDGDFWPIDTTYFVRTEAPLIYCFHLLQTLEFIDSHAAVPGLSRDQAYGLKVLRPPAEVLERFAVVVDQMYELRSNLIRQNTALRQARDLLLPRLISGELDLSRLELDLEPVA